mgnify:CR=1 FL=1
MRQTAVSDAVMNRRKMGQMPGIDLPSGHIQLVPHVKAVNVTMRWSVFMQKREKKIPVSVYTLTMPAVAIVKKLSKDLCYFALSHVGQCLVDQGF